MTKKTQEQLVQQLKTKEKYRFTEFELCHEGNYEISDADWNYKDVPHLTHIHHLVEGYPGYTGNDFISAILVQKVFGIKFPAVLFNYESGKNRQTYFITMLIYMLIVETSYESLGKNRTRVRTRYAIGCRSWLASLLFPLAKFAIKRNYQDLMSGDIPMRERRGWLRDKGYTFKGDQKSYSFFETSLIMEQNVIPPPQETETRSYTFDPSLIQPGNPMLLGEADQYGLSVHSDGTSLNFFLRLCPHEGANLTKKCDGKVAICEWHGRRFNPEFKIQIQQLESGWQQQSGGRFAMKFQDGNLNIEVSPMQKVGKATERAERTAHVSI
jgi:hypothetical protein